MASDFLNNLKKTVETGEFNSEAAKKIIEIANLADNKAGSTQALDKAYDELNKIKPELVSEEEAAAINSAYERKMADIKKQDAINLQLATLVDVEDMVKASVDDMFSFVTELEEKFKEGFESQDPLYGELYMKIESLKSKYNSITN